MSKNYGHVNRKSHVSSYLPLLLPNTSAQTPKYTLGFIYNRAIAGNVMVIKGRYRDVAQRK